MRPDSLRFSPPQRELPPEVEWALLSAFGGAGYSGSEPLDSTTALAWVRRLSLGPRIGSRATPSRLAAQVGAHAAGQIADDLRRSVTGALRVRETTDVVWRAARERGAQPVVLKGAALELLGVAPPGSRPVLDLDLLVARSDADVLGGALEQAGFERARSRDDARHLAAWTHPVLAPVEPHLVLPGVTIPGRGAATAGALFDASLVDRTPDGDVAVPARVILVAHCIAHAVFQHGYSPRGYPLFRAVGDLLDSSGGRPLDALVSEAAAYLGQSVSLREAMSLAQLGSSLAAGHLPQPGSDADAVLRHAVEGARDAAYCRRLRWRSGMRAVRNLDWRKVASSFSRSPGPRSA